MFDLIVTGHRKTGRRGLAPLVVSSAVHVLAIGGVVTMPLLFATSQLPDPGEILTFVSVAPLPPPPPPPPPPSAAKPVSPRRAPTPRPNPRPVEVLTMRELPAPVEAPASIEAPPDVGEDFGSLDGVPGGMVGGVAGGVVGGVVGGLPEGPPALPPPAPPAPRAPVRTGGQIQAPALIKRVPPVYPPIAANARVQGVVILDATVGRDGRVEDVQVVRSVGLLDKAAVDAVRQWEYAPLLLNGKAERFVLTVTLRFSLS